MNKEKIENLALYLLAAVVMVIVFYTSYNYGSERYAQNDIPIGQEYHVKEVLIEANSSFLIRYHENDNNMTEKIKVTSAKNKFNLIQTNSSQPMMVLDKIENHIKYWNIYANDEQIKINKK